MDYLQRFWQKGWRAGIAVAAVLVCVAVSQISPAEAETAASKGPERLLTIHDQSTKQTIITTERTLDAALREAGISIETVDAVEPALTTELIAKNYQVNVYRARPVLVIDGTRRQRIITAEQSPKRIVEAAGGILYDEDTTAINQVGDESVLADGGAGLKLTIDRAVPFSFVLYGKKIDAHTQAATVREMLREKGVDLGPKDGVSLSLETPITAGMTVTVWRDGVQTVTQDEVIAPPTREIQDADREIGYRAVESAGKPGKRTATYEVNTQNGVEIARREINSIILEQPVERVERVGIKSKGFSGPLGEAMAKLRSCEAGGHYDRNSGNGYYGAYQYNISTWANYGGYYLPSDAPGAVQDAKALETYNRRGWSPWPGCTKKLGLQDIYR